MIFSLIEIFIPLFSEFFIRHKSRTTLNTSNFLIILTLIEKWMLEVNWIFIEEFSAFADWNWRFPLFQWSKVYFITREIICELGDKWFIEARVVLEEVGVSLFLWTSHKWTSSSGNFLIIRRGRINLLITSLLRFVFLSSRFLSFRVWTFWLFRVLAWFFIFILHKRTLFNLFIRI